MKATTATKFLVLLLVVAAALPSAFALSNLINVSFGETVYQNVTYARYFDLVENRTYSLIVGEINVTNMHSDDSVFDIYVKLVNTQYLQGNFLYSSGRAGSQVIYPKNNSVFTNLTINITAAYTDMGYDLDEDGTNDSVALNDTHILFNLTSEYQILAYQLINQTGDVADLSTPNIFNNSEVNITSVRSDGDYNDGVLFARFTVNGTQATGDELSHDEVTLTLNDTERQYAILHIPELRAGQATQFDYNVSSVFVDPPLDINTTYTDPEFASKVLAGEAFAVTDTATNLAQVGNLIIINITIAGLGVETGNATVFETHNFTLHNLSDTGDYANVYGNGTNDRLWYWVTNGGVIPIGQTFNISYYVRAPDTVPTSATYAAVEQNLTYLIEATASNLSLQEVRARAEINFTTTKQIIQPQDNLSNNNVTWRSVPSVGTYKDINFTLEQVTLWVTSTRDPNIVANNLETTYTINENINLTSSWIGSAWLFNFTDGSSDANPPPIIWIKPYWIIQNAGGQIINQSYTVNGTDIYVKYIYVVNGYWLEVFKNVTASGDDQYNIKVHVHNRGNGHTPQNLTVTVYDFIPDDFTAFNFTPSYNNASNVSGQYTGTAYQWDVGLRTNVSTSFAPNGDSLEWDEYYLNYTVNGTGDFRVSDLYIVGLDPRRVDGASGSEQVTILAGIASTNKELLYLFVVVFLIAVNVGNFMMTSRINKKLDKKE